MPGSLLRNAFFLPLERAVFLEKTPAIKEIAGSLFIGAKK